MEKYELIPQQLLHEGLVEKESFFSPSPVKDFWIEKAHDKEYISKLNHLSLSKSEIRKTGFPLSRELVHREYVITQGTLDCVDFAIDVSLVSLLIIRLLTSQRQQFHPILLLH